jgi:hypothetical protein
MTLHMAVQEGHTCTGVMFCASVELLASKVPLHQRKCAKHKHCIKESAPSVSEIYVLHPLLNFSNVLGGSYD